MIHQPHHLAVSQSNYLDLMARAKRERVVQDEVEKANRRPTRLTDTARPDRRDTTPSLLL